MESGASSGNSCVPCPEQLEGFSPSAGDPQEPGAGGAGRLLEASELVSLSRAPLSGFHFSSGDSKE